MANYANLKSDIAGVIRTNNNEEITGDILQEQLLGMVDSLGAGFQYKGVATPTTAPGTPDENVFYIASTAGTYTNFGGLVVADGEVAILKYNGSWAKEVTGAATAVQVTQLGQEAIYDVSARNGGATFASLSALLSSENLSTLIPIAVRCGGMSIRFVQSSDNKYVQYRLMTDEWSVNIEDWAITDEGVYVENPEFVYIKTDVEGKILWAIKTDGNIYYGAGCPQQIKDYIEERISLLSLDEYEDIVAFLNDLEKGDKTLSELLGTKVDKDEVELIPSFQMANLPESQGEQSVVDLTFLQNKVLNAVGDSVTEGDYFRTNVAQNTNLIIRNYGLASSTIAINNTYLTNQSIVERVLGINGNPPCEDADIWMIFGGINDINYASPIGIPEDTDNNTVYGALKSICTYIRQRPNNPKLILVTPYQLKYRDGDYERNIVSAIKYVAKLFSCPVIDLYNNSDFCHSNIDNLLFDGFHPNSRGKIVLSTALTKGLLNECLSTFNSKYLVNSPEYINLLVDKNNKVIEANREDGTKVFYSPVEIQGVTQKTIESPEWIEIKVDGDNKILSGIKKDGTVYINELEIGHEDTDALQFLGLPKNICDKLLYFGTFNGVNEQTAQNLLKLYDKSKDGYMQLKAAATGGVYIEGTAIPNIENNQELPFICGVSYRDLVMFDFNTVFVQYQDNSPNYIEKVAVADSNAVFSDLEKDILMKELKLPVFRDNNLNPNGVIKSNRGITKSNYLNLISSPTFNTSFGWTLGATWSISDNKAHCNDPNATMASLLQNNLDLDVGSKYKVAFSIQNYVSGKIQLRIDWNVYESVGYSGNSFVEIEFVYSRTTAGHAKELMFRPMEEGFVGDIVFVELLKIEY